MDVIQPAILVMLGAYLIVRRSEVAWRLYARAAAHRMYLKDAGRRDQILRLYSRMNFIAGVVAIGGGLYAVARTIVSCTNTRLF